MLGMASIREQRMMSRLLNYLVRKLSFWIQRIRTVRRDRLTNPQVEMLRFFQFKSSTADYFTAKTGKTDIRITDTPHYELAKAFLKGSGLAEAEKEYKKYLSVSWNSNDEEALQRRVDAFREHFRAANQGGSAKPAILCKIGSDYYVVDGNHRSAIEAALQHGMSVEIWPASLAFSRYAKIDAFYGTGYKNIPYQSLFVDGEIIVPGRRVDTIERLRLIPTEAIQAQSILDIGCNVGMSSILARQMGAKNCLGLEYSPKITDIANRLAMFNGTYPATLFRPFDVDADVLDDQLQFDTAFLFSIYRHLKSPDRLCDLVQKHVTRHVVFEGHPRDTIEHYARFFESGLFARVQELGRLAYSAEVPERCRILWLCVRK